MPAVVHSPILAGYSEQLKVLARQYGSRKSAVFGYPFSGASLVYPILVKPLSRGAAHIAPDDDGVSLTGRGNPEPLVAYRTRSKPHRPSDHSRDFQVDAIDRSSSSASTHPTYRGGIMKTDLLIFPHAEFCDLNSLSPARWPCCSMTHCWP